MVFAPFYVEAPAVKPIPYGLFTVAEVRDTNDSHWSGGGIEFENHLGCGNNTVAVQPCDTPVAKDEFIEPEYITGEPWTVYSQYTCRGPSEFNNAKKYAVDALVASEERGVEAAVMTQLLTDATDVTPAGGALQPQNGIALLEGTWGDQGGPFRPIFHLDRTTAALGWGLLDRHGNHLETELGSLVSAGAGYFGVSFDADDGTAWIVATGPMVVYRGVAQAHDPVFVQDPLDNTFVALAERTFSWAWICTPLKVQVNVTSAVGAL